MKAVVTGGCGFIGSHLVESLLSQDMEVLVLDNCSTGRVANISGFLNNPRLTFKECDIADSQINLEKEFEGASFIFHLAALADIVPSIETPSTYYHSNVTGTMRVMEAAKKTSGLKKLVYAASSSCYGIPDETPTKETAEIRPQYPYALTKYLGEQIVLHWGKLYKTPVISLRLFNVFGPKSRTSGTYGAVFGVFLAQKLHGRPFTIVGDGNQTRDFTYVKDVVSAFVAASQSKVSGEIMNVGSGHHYSVNLLVELLGGGEKAYIPKRPGEPDITFADTTKIRTLLNWKPHYSFEQGVQSVLENINYWREAPVWTQDSISRATKSWFEALQN